MYRIGPDLALVQTVDFFTPILDDPYDYGRVAAANALSDVYAMGGRPLTALNILCYPPGFLNSEHVAAILRGGSDKVREAGATVAGGHTIQDKEPKYGLSVTGLVHPDHVVRNVGAQPGDRLVLTKPLGTGVLTTGLKAGMVDDHTREVVTEGMASLNRAASEAMLEVGVHAATDVTGFGLLGHLWEMVCGSEVSAEVYSLNIPYYHGTLALAHQGVFPGGAHATRQYLDRHVMWDDTVSDTVLMTLCDPQTSGGLLMAVAPNKHEALLDALLRRHCACSTVGEITSPGAESKIVVVG